MPRAPCCPGVLGIPRDVLGRAFTRGVRSYGFAQLPPDKADAGARFDLKGVLFYLQRKITLLPKARTGFTHVGVRDLDEKGLGGIESPG